MDNILLLAESRNMFVDHLTGTVHLLENLGSIINQKKSVLISAQSIEFLGLVVVSLAMELCLPLIKIKQMRAEASTGRNNVSLCAGMPTKHDECNKQCHSPGSPLLSPIANDSTLERHLQSYEVRITLIQECIQELEWWNHNMCNWSDKTLLNREVDLTIDSDASLLGWGHAATNKE